MIQLRPGFCQVLRYHLSRRPLARFFALRYHPLLHLPLYLPKQAVLLLDRPSSQRGKEIKTVVRVITLEGLVNHCEFVKELMDYLEFVFSGKGNVSRIFDVCKAFYRSESLTEFFMAFKMMHEELNMLMPFSPDVKVQQSQREQMTVMRFLAALPSEYDSAKARILSSPEISSLQETFSKILRTEVSSSSSPTLVSTQTSSALIG